MSFCSIVGADMTSRWSERAALGTVNRPNPRHLVWEQMNQVIRLVCAGAAVDQVDAALATLAFMTRVPRRQEES